MLRRRIVRLVMATSFLALLIFSVFGATAFAAPITPNIQSNSTFHIQNSLISSTASCAHLQIYLHGVQPTTIKCLDKRINGNVTPFGILAVPCDSGSLVLWEDSGFSGATLCLKGAGSTDLTSYCLPWYRGGCAGGNWNDRVSSYAPGCSFGTIYADIGQNNPMVSFSGNGIRQNLTGTNNDKASSVTLHLDC